MAIPEIDNENITNESIKNTVDNLKAWGKTGAVIPVHQKNIIQIESSPTPKIGSIIFSAQDAYTDANRINDNYDKDELDSVMDDVIKHFKQQANVGDLNTYVATHHYNNGLTNAIIKELKHRGFTVDATRKNMHIKVSWDQKFKNKNIKYILVLVLLLVLLYVFISSKLIIDINNEPQQSHIEMLK